VSKLQEMKRVGAEDMQGAPEWFIENYLPYQNSFNEDVSARINGDIGVVNTTDAIRRAKMVHGVEKVVANPLGKPGKRPRPIGIVAIDSDGLPVAGSVIWRNVAPDKLGVTVQFAPPFGRIDFEKSANQAAIASNTLVDVTWDVETIKAGALSHSSGSALVTCASAGIVRVSYDLTFEVGGTAAFGSFIGGYIVCSSTSRRFGETRVQAECANGETINGSDDVRVNAGDQIKIAARHLNSTATARDLRGNSDQACYFRAGYIAPPAGYSANVTFRIMGA
jgi:hypothetical protein